MRCTGSLGCAPTESQYCARSELTSISEGSSLGWYTPMYSIARPSRFVRESATTMRYCGLRILPIRRSRIRTATVYSLLDLIEAGQTFGRRGDGAVSRSMVGRRAGVDRDGASVASRRSILLLRGHVRFKEACSLGRS